MWYYWSVAGVNGNGIPWEQAVSFNKAWGDQVRISGFGGGVDPEWLYGEDQPSSISSYHIDTPEGLAAFVELLGDEPGLK